MTLSSEPHRAAIRAAMSALGKDPVVQDLQRLMQAARLGRKPTRAAWERLEQRMGAVATGFIWAMARRAAVAERLTPRQQHVLQFGSLVMHLEREKKITRGEAMELAAERMEIGDITHRALQRRMTEFEQLCRSRDWVPYWHRDEELGLLAPTVFTPEEIPRVSERGRPKTK